MERDGDDRAGRKESGIEEDEGGRNQVKEVFLALFLIHVSFGFSSSPPSHFMGQSTLLSLVIPSKTCTHSPTKSQVGN